MLHLMLVFGHLLATSMALGAIVATDLRMLSKLAQDRVRIPPPNQFVARLVTIALVLLYATGAGMLLITSQQQADLLLDPKLQGKLVLVVLLTFNAVVLHRYTFPRLARGRSVGRWHPADWAVVVMPVALSNCLWMFCAFLGIARPWNHSMPMREVLEIAASLYALALLGVGLVLAAAARRSPDGKTGRLVALVKRLLASVGSLGQDANACAKRQRSRDRARARSYTPMPPTPRRAAAAGAPRAADLEAPAALRRA